MLKVLLTFLFASLCVFETAASAQENVLVRVRLLRATDKSMLGFKSFVDSPKLDPAILDLKEKLEALPFEQFVLLSSEERSMPLKKKDIIQFKCGQVLHLRPLSIDGNKVSLWLNWEDSSGQTILDTRMHFDSSQSLLAGTDSTDDTGLLLAVDVRPGGPVGDGPSR